MASRLFPLSLFPRAKLLASDATGATSLLALAESARSLADARRLIPGAACVLLDLGLPDARDLQALRYLLQHYPEAAIVVLTGRPDDAWLASWSRAEAAVPHPIDPIVLGRTVLGLLRAPVQ